MPSINAVTILVNPAITPEQLFSFYERNNICEVGYGQEIASRVLTHSSVIVGAFEGETIVGLARALCDGVAAAIMEFSMALEYQGASLRHRNGSLIERDALGVGQRIGTVLLEELGRMGATFITVYLVEGCEEAVYESLGFQPNTGHLVYYMDKRPYVEKQQGT